MNLLTEQWIPILKADGTETFISPYELTVGFQNNPVKSLNAPRADFNGALAQFLIGLLQTALPNLIEEDWDEWYEEPPSTDELKSLFKPLETAFNFDHSSPSFMQDFALPEGEKKSVAALFIEQPGQQTLELNADHFIKRNSIKKLCYHCAVMALFTLQINAPSGGAGHRTSVRGGGPLTTLVISDNEERKTLWHMLWLNIVPALHLKQYLGTDSLDISELKTVFPWLAPTCTSEKEANAIRPRDAHPLQNYWCMPRRIRLDFQDTIKGHCDVCGNASEQLIQFFITKNYGINYKEGWKHPLSPYRYDDKGMPISLHPQPDSTGYKYWQAIVLDEPAGPIKTFNAHPDNQSTDKSIKIWAFGYDMDNMKARSWYESTMPFYYVKEEARPKLVQDGINLYFKAIKLTLKYLYIALKNTNAHTKTAEMDFWQATEEAFYNILSATIEALNKDINDSLTKWKEQWLEHLQEKALAVFEQYADLQHPQLTQIQALATAKNDLRKHLYGSKIRKELELEPKRKQNAHST